MKMYNTWKWQTN